MQIELYKNTPTHFYGSELLYFKTVSYSKWNAWQSTVAYYLYAREKYGSAMQ